MAVESTITSIIGRDKALLLSKISQLNQDALVDCCAFFMGNDPIAKSDLKPYQANNPFILVGTSIFGAIAIACHLGEKVTTPPQVIIVDNSQQVAKSWGLIKIFFSSSTETSPEQFIKDFLEMLQQNKVSDFSMDIYSADTMGELSNALLDLIKAYGFEYVKQLVNETLVLKQSWADAETFQRIREVYKDYDIYAYPSNIIHCIDDIKTQKEVARSVAILKPVISIQTNLKDGGPTALHLIRDNSVSSIMKTLGPGPFLPASGKLQFKEEFSIKSTSELKPSSVAATLFSGVNQVDTVDLPLNHKLSNKQLNCIS